jgi:hypothetical protein
MTAQRAYDFQQELATRRRASGGLGQSTLTSAISSTVSSAARAAVQDITLRTQVTPDWTYNTNAPVQQGGFGAWVTRNVIKPSLVLNTPGGAVEYAPYGKPKINLFPVLALATVGGLAVGGYFAFKGIRASLQG